MHAINAQQAQWQLRDHHLRSTDHGIVVVFSDRSTSLQWLTTQSRQRAGCLLCVPWAIRMVTCAQVLALQIHAWWLMASHKPLVRMSLSFQATSVLSYSRSLSLLQDKLVSGSTFQGRLGYLVCVVLTMLLITPYIITYNSFDFFIEFDNLVLFIFLKKEKFKTYLIYILGLTIS